MIKKSNFKVSGNIVDVVAQRIFTGTIHINEGRISEIREEPVKNNEYILPGLIDAHIHIESSMLIPSEFARLAVVHGTVATVSDPHEIANVCGIEGVRFMIENGKRILFKFYFGAPSCVPATSFETAGGEITSEDISKLFADDNLHYLSEMMNYPGVLFNDPVVVEKLNIAKKYGKPVDGHAPGLKGDDIIKYVSAGISTDHECFTLDEAIGKIALGMKILIREGSSAKNYEALKSLIKDHTDYVMFCSDDKHPDDLVDGHINEIIKRSLKNGFDIFDVLKCACVNPVRHYNLESGLLQNGDPADFIIINNLEEFNILKTFINGELVAENGKSLIPSVKTETINNFNTGLKSPYDFVVKFTGDKIRVIGAIEGELITKQLLLHPKIENGHAISDVENDILKLTVVNRYQEAKPAVAFINGLGLKKGAMASSVGHDSHNILAAGTNDADLCNAVNLVIKHKGGISVVNGNEKYILPLPVGGIMSLDDGFKLAKDYATINKIAKTLGTNLNAPFMTLSFMALLVIPALKLSDKGLFDGNNFTFIDLKA